ncbi:hypothetical protein PR048_025865 [Dryococelus australis]|uniref:Uncharacterized protein n=1 Tax=Dryococelus australis TaxID=614101 RepID=A0ABQ9GJQ2_9NEOP|nr:hypothetical protein PR048_025865 [Dryococelus australis]
MALSSRPLFNFAHTERLARGEMLINTGRLATPSWQLPPHGVSKLESAVVPERLHRLPPTNINRVQSLAGVSEEIWAARNIEVLRVDEGEAKGVRSSTGMQWRGKWEIPEKTLRPPASSGAITTRKNPGMIMPGAMFQRLQCSPMGLARPEPRPQHYRTSFGRFGSPGEGSSGEWRRIPVDVLQTLAESMPDRVAAVIAAIVLGLDTEASRQFAKAVCVGMIHNNTLICCDCSFFYIYSTSVSGDKVVLDVMSSAVHTEASEAERSKRGKRDIPEKTCRPAASSSAIPTCEYSRVTPPGIEPSSPWWVASSLTTLPPRPPVAVCKEVSATSCTCKFGNLIGANLGGWRDEAKEAGRKAWANRSRPDTNTEEFRRLEGVASYMTMMVEAARRFEGENFSLEAVNDGRTYMYSWSAAPISGAFQRVFQQLSFIRCCCNHARALVQCVKSLAQSSKHVEAPAYLSLELRHSAPEIHVFLRNYLRAKVHESHLLYLYNTDHDLTSSTTCQTRILVHSGRYVKRTMYLRVQGQEASERYGRHSHACLVSHRSYAQGAQCFSPNALLYKLDLVGNEYGRAHVVVAAVLYVHVRSNGGRDCRPETRLLHHTQRRMKTLIALGEQPTKAFVCIGRKMHLAAPTTYFVEPSSHLWAGNPQLRARAQPDSPASHIEFFDVITSLKFATIVGGKPENPIITKSEEYSLHCSSESIVYIQNAITLLACQRIKECVTLNDYIRQKVKSKDRNRVRLERASQKQSLDTYKTPYDRVKRYRERKINTKASDCVNVGAYSRNEHERPNPIFYLLFLLQI